MDLSNDPEIICVFCGLGFTSVENVELHIHQSHQSNSVDQIENRKTSVSDDYEDHTLADGSFFMSNKMKEINLIVAQKDVRSDKSSQEPSEVHKAIKRSLRCRSCDKQFTLSNNLSRHRRLYCSSLKDSNLQDSYCQNGIIESHKAAPSTILKCVIINKLDDISKQTYDGETFIVKKEVRAKLTKSLQKHKCPKCFKRFIFKISQIIHLQNHEINDNRKWKCEKCGFRYSRKQILLHHYQRNCLAIYSSPKSRPKSDHEIYPKSHPCQFCELVFTDPLYVEMHQLRVCQRCPTSQANGSLRRRKTNTENVYKVSKGQINGDLLLSKESSSKSCSIDQSVSDMFENGSSPRSPEIKLNDAVKIEVSLNNGTKKFHWHNYNDEIQQKSFQCEVCKKSFSSRSSLSNHIKSHYSSRGQPFTCRDCNRRFVNLLSLQDHRREMCSQKSYESDQKAIYNLSNFNGVSQVPIWPNITNTNAGNQPVTCLHCNGVFYDRLELEEHALSKHSNEQGNILCLLCDRSFTTNMALRVHLTKSHGFANGGCPGVSQNLPPMPKLETNYHIGGDFPIKKRRKDKRLYDLDKEYSCDNCHRNFSTGQALGNHKRACLNMPNEFISVDYKAPSQNSKSNSKIHSIESLIFDNTNICSSFTHDKNVFLAFN